MDVEFVTQYLQMVHGRTEQEGYAPRHGGAIQACPGGDWAVRAGGTGRRI